MEQKIITINGVSVQFPFPPYPSQIALMDRLIKSIVGGKNAMLESPTGSGKTLALLCASLASASPEMKIYFGTRTHKQVAQIVSELKSTGYKPKMTVLGSRAQYCIHPDSKDRPSASSLNDFCLNVRKDGKCSSFKKVHSLVSRNRNEIFDIEDLIKFGKRIDACPYYASRYLATDAKLIICPYNYLIDPDISSKMGIDVTNSILIFDEGHNIEDICKDAGSVQISGLEIKSLQRYLEVQKLFLPETFVWDLNELINSLEKIYGWASGFDKVQKFEFKADEFDVALWTSSPLLSILTEIGFTVKSLEPLCSSFNNIKVKLEGDSNATLGIEETSGDNASQKAQAKEEFSMLGFFDKLIWILQYIYANTHHSDEYSFALLKKLSSKEEDAESEREQFKVAFWLYNPGAVFKRTTFSARSVILTSGTLSPLDTFSSELGIDFPLCFEARHVLYYTLSRS